MVTIKSIYDENRSDHVSDFLKEISNKSEIHGKFIIVMLEQLMLMPLNKLLNEDTLMTIVMKNGNKLTRKYRLVKELRKKPIYELRYGVSGNEHLRILFFPLSLEGKRYYMFTHAFIKTRTPPFDPTNKFRDESYNIYMSVKNNPEKLIGNKE